MLEISMRLLNQERKFEWKRFPVYTVEEARNEGIEFVDWRVAKVGQWLVSDDGMVGICVRRYEYEPKKEKSKVKGKVLSPVGFGLLRKGGQMLFSKRSQKDWEAVFSRTMRFKVAVSMYATYLVNGRKIDWEELGKVISPSSKSRSLIAKRVFRRPNLMDAVRKETLARLEKAGFSVEKVMGDWQKLLTMCENKQDTTNFRMAVEKLSDMLELTPAKKTMSFNANTTLPSTAGFLPELTEEDREMEVALAKRLGSEKALATGADGDA